MKPTRRNKDAVKMFAVTILFATASVVCLCCSSDDDDPIVLVTEENLRVCRKLVSFDKTNPRQMKETECFCAKCGNELVACEKDARCSTLSRTPERVGENAMKEAAALLEKRDSCMKKHCLSP